MRKYCVLDSARIPNTIGNAFMLFFELLVLVADIVALSNNLFLLLVEFFILSENIFFLKANFLLSFANYLFQELIFFS